MDSLRVLPMQLPVTPPPFDTLLQATIAQSPALLPRLMRSVSEVDEQGRYLHWDKLRHLPAPDGLTSEHWWLGIKLARRKNFKPLPLFDHSGAAFQYSLPAIVHKQLHWLDRHAQGSIQVEAAVTNPQTRDNYLIRSLTEETISSTQLADPAPQKKEAKERTRKAPEDTTMTE